MPLESAHSVGQIHQEREVRTLLERTEDALVQSAARLRRTVVGLNRAR